MQRVTCAEDVKRLGTILGVWAHPDDESFLAAGIMMAALQNGQVVACVTATKGEEGMKDEARWPKEHLGEIRSAEMKAALKILGCDNHSWLGYHDGKCSLVTDQEGADRIAELIDRLQPQTILTFDSTGLTGHPDHQAVSRWATLAAKKNKIQVYYAVEEKNIYKNYMKKADKQFNFFFNIKKPPIKDAGECDIAFRLPEDLLDKKIKALRAMPSQTEDIFKAMPVILRAALQIECFSVR